MSTEFKKSKYELDMCNGPIMRKLVSFSVPLILSGNLQLLFNAVDIIVVGKFTGRQALAAVGSTSSLINMLITFFIGISLGTNVMTGRFYAAKKDKQITDIVHTSILFALLSGIFIAVVGLFSSRWALQLMSTPEDIIDQAALYMRIYLMGMPFFMMYNYGAAILRAVGDTKRPLIFLIAAGIINAGLNMVLVIVFHLGVVGVAVATMISEMISCILVLRCLYKTEGSYQLRFSKLRIRWVYLKEMLQVGLPAGIQSVVINFSNVLLQSSVNSFGSVATAGYTAANNIFGFLYATVNAFSQTCMTFISQNYGVQKWKRMDKILIECTCLSIGVTLVLGSLVYLFGPQLLGIYTTSPEVVQWGMEVLVYTSITYFFCGIMDLLPGAMRGIGCSAVPMILSIIGTVGVRIFWIYCIFPSHHEMDVLFISYPLSWTITVIMQYTCFYFVRKKIYPKKSINYGNV